MSFISAEERRKLPREDFGDPEHELFPIRDQEDLNNAAHLIGKAAPGVKKRIIEIARRKSLKLPMAWEEARTDTNMSIEFACSAGRREEGGFAVYPDSLLFRAGQYPDKKIDVSLEDLWAIQQNFKPLSGNMLHSDMLKGRACHVDSVRMQGDELRGQVRVPLGLDALLSDQERKLSVEIEHATKQLSGLALVTQPRVTGAALMSLEADPCAVIARAATGGATMPDNSNDQAVAEAVRAERQTIMERVTAFFGGNKDQAAQIAGIVGSQKTVNELALEAKIAAMEQAQFAQGDALRTATAKEKALALAKSGKIHAYEIASVATEFARAMADDHAHPATVNFSIAKDGQAETVAMSRTARLETLYDRGDAMGDTRQRIQQFPAEAYAAFSNELGNGGPAQAQAEMDKRAIENAARDLAHRKELMEAGKLVGLNGANGNR